MSCRNLLFLFLIQGTCCMLLFLFLKLLHYFSHRETGFVRGSFACWFLFVKLNLSWYLSSWNLLDVGFFYVKHDECWFSFVKFVVCGLFFQETWFILIYFLKKHALLLFLLHETCCMLIFFPMKPNLLMELVCWFLFVKFLDIFLCETCCIWITSLET